MSYTITNRYSASAVHFMISLAVFSLFVFVLLKYWFPEPYFSTNGGWQGLQIVAAIDLILGPMLTLIIFNINKSRKELMLDFSLIAIIQISALCWGISTLYTQRPLAITFWEDKFYSISAEHFPAYDIEFDVLKQFGDSYPVYIYIQEPTTSEGKQTYLRKTWESIPPNLQPELYTPLSEHYQDIFEHSIDISHAINKNPELKQEITTLLAKTNTKLEQNYYIPLKTGFTEILLIFDKDNKRIGYAMTPYI